jgi:hypothetical protein
LEGCFGGEQFGAQRVDETGDEEAAEEVGGEKRAQRVEESDEAARSRAGGLAGHGLAQCGWGAVHARLVSSPH